MTMLAPHETSPNTATRRESRQKPAADLEIKYRNEAANYVAAMIAELRQISGKAGFEKLVAVLETAYYEAYSLTDAKVQPPAAVNENTQTPLEPSHS